MPSYRLASYRPSSGKFWVDYSNTVEPVIEDSGANLVTTMSPFYPENESLSVESNALAPRTDDPRIEYCLQLHAKGDIEAAQAAMRKIIADDPDVALFHNIAGALLADSGNLEDALVCFDQALSIEPGFAEAHNNLGLAQHRLGHPDLAIVSYERALALVPSLENAHYNLSNAELDIGNMEKAIDGFLHVVKLKPSHAAAHRKLGYLHETLGKDDAAVSSYVTSGVYYSRRGDYEAAIDAFRKAIMIDARHIDAHLALGSCFHRVGNLVDAQRHLKLVLSLDKDNAQALHFLNAAQGITPASAPTTYVRELFDSYANGFEKHLLSSLSYRGPAAVKALFDKCVSGSGRVGKMLDLGCGTGLIGLEFRGAVDFMVGVDLSVQMITKAREKSIYDELHVDDLSEFLDRSDIRYDLFVAADVFNYVGDMRSALSSIKKSANSQALVFFTTEDSEGDGFYLQSSGRYSHSYNYVSQLAGEMGFDIKYFERENLRKSSDDWVVAGFYVLICPKRPITQRRSLHTD